MTPSDSRGSTSAVAGLFPGYFAMVMATGIIAIAAFQQDIGWLADSLYVIAAAAYGVLVVLTLLRLVGFGRLLVADLTSHAKGFAFLTTVAATNVLGSASAIVHGWWDLAWVLWWISLAAGPSGMAHAQYRADPARAGQLSRRNRRARKPSGRSCV